MSVLADAGHGLIDEKITKRYFLKLVRNFGVLVSYLDSFSSIPVMICTQSNRSFLRFKPDPNKV